MEFVGQGAQAFGQHADAGDVHRQLAGFGFEQVAFRAHDVAQIPVFEVFVKFQADVFALHIHLHPARAVLQGGETGLAHDPLQDHATSDANGVLFLDQDLGRLGTMGGVQGFGVVGGFEIVGESDWAAKRLPLAHVLQFVAAFGNQLVVVLGSGGGCVF